MKSLAMFLAVAIAAVAAIAATEDVNASRVIISGDVVRYEAGKTIVVRSADGKEVTYAIAPALAAPAGVVVGRRVTLVTEASDSGAVAVTRITTEPGQEATTTVTETTVAPPAPEPKTQITSEYGTVSDYEAGRTITLLRPNATTVTYTIDSKSTIPADLAKGRKVVVRTVTRPGSQPVVRKVTYSKTQKTTAG